jgi:hypothetical protein
LEAPDEKSAMAKAAEEFNIPPARKTCSGSRSAFEPGGVEFTNGDQPDVRMRAHAA